MSDESLTPPTAADPARHHVSPLGIVTSLTIGKIATALSSFQGKVKNPPKSKEADIPSKGGGAGSGYQYKYADFAESLDLLRPVLAAEGLSFIQLPVIDGGDLNVVTRVMHDSGEWIEGAYPVGVIGEHRTMGGALTYAKRYSLFSIIGVSGEDDLDAEPAITAEPSRGAARGTQSRKAETPQAKRGGGGEPAKKEVERMSMEDSIRASGAMQDALAKCQTREEELAWAQDHSAIKASLQPIDAKAVTDAFTAHQRDRREREKAVTDAPPADEKAAA